MTRRTTAILVAIAVLGGAAVAGVGLATRGSSKPARVLQIDENLGRVGQVVLGETFSNLIGALGPPVTSTSLGVAPSQTLGYPHLTLTLGVHGVSAIRTDDPAATTLQAVRIGEPLSAARASYGKAATCNPNSPDKTAAHPFCTIRVRSGQLLVSGDPIRAITLSRSR